MPRGPCICPPPPFFSAIRFSTTLEWSCADVPPSPNMEFLRIMAQTPAKMALVPTTIAPPPPREP